MIDNDLLYLVGNIFPDHELIDIRILRAETMGFSGACVEDLHCTWKINNNSSTMPVEYLFLKHVVFESLQETTPKATVVKNIRDRLSYQNELNSMGNLVPEWRKYGINVPTLYESIHTFNNEKEICGNERFLFLSEGMRHRATHIVEFGRNEFSSTLRCMARMHAVYMGLCGNSSLSQNQNEDDEGKGPSPENKDTVTDIMPNAHSINSKYGVWSQGTHLALSKRPAGEVDGLASIWKDFCAAFAWPDLADVGEKLMQVAPMVSELLSSTNHDRNYKSSTIIHGDMKPANIFFPREKHTEGNNTCTAVDYDDVYVIDFQWTGIGLGVTDIVYMIATACSDECLSTLDIDRDVLLPYYNMLCEVYTLRHQSQGGSSSEEATGLNEYSYTSLQIDFKLALLDYVRWAVAYRLKGQTPAKYAEQRENVNINLGAYRRSEAIMRFLFDKTKVYLEELDSILRIPEKT